jgi:hypothetical protein
MHYAVKIHTCQLKVCRFERVKREAEGWLKSIRKNWSYIAIRPISGK